MKRILLIIPLFLLLVLYSPVLAKNDKEKTNNSKANREVSVQTETEEDSEEDSDDTEEDSQEVEYKSPSELAKERNAIKKLEKIKDQTQIQVVEEEIDEVTETQEEVQDRVEETLEEVDQRPAAVKFLIGPDYKNLGQLRKEVVHTRNNIRKLEKVREQVTGETQAAVDEAIEELESTALNLQASVGEKLEGFSLFGWLARWLSGFDAPDEEPTVTPVPSEEPTETPDVSPSPTYEPTTSPEPTPVESPSVTEEPVPSPDITQ